MDTSLIESPALKTGHDSGSRVAVLMKSIRRQFDRIQHQRRIRQNVNRLMEFDDHLLADIGISRGEVLHAVRYGRLPARRNERPRQ